MTRKPTPQMLPGEPNVLDEIFAAPGVSRETGLQLHYVPLSRVVDNPYQTRLKNKPDHVLGIASSLLQMTPSLADTKGLQQVPIGRLVNYGDGTPAPAAAYSSGAQLRRLVADPAYVVELAFGHSRRLAFEVLAKGVATVFPDMAGAEQVALNGAEFDPALYADMPVILRDVPDAEMWIHAATENGQRENISAIEEATAIKRATTELGMTMEEAGKAMNKSRSAASNLVRLLDLPDKYQQAIFDGVMTEKHGRLLLTLRGAFHAIEHGHPAEIGAMSTRELEEFIKLQIARCQPLAPLKNMRYSSARGVYNGVSAQQFDLPAWPFDWTGDGKPGIVGACDGCQWRLTFNGDPGPRCTNQIVKDGYTCYETKNSVWEANQRAKQAASATAKLAEQQVQAAPPAAATATMEQSAAAPAPAANPAPQAKIADADATVYWFMDKNSYGEAPSTLLEREMCSQERCECFVLAYNRFADDRCVRPDPVGAPNMCYGCTSRNRLQHRKQELELGDVKAHRQAIKTENDACEELVRHALYNLPAGQPWNNATFLRDLVVASSDVSNISRRTGFASADVSLLVDDIWMAVAGYKCRQWSNMTVAGNSSHWKMERVRKWLKSLSVPASAGWIWAELADDEQQPEPVAEVATIPADDVAAQLAEFGDQVRDEIGVATAVPTEFFTPDAPPAAPAGTVGTLPDDLVAHGWELKQSKGNTWRAHIVVDGQDFQTRGNTDLQQVIGDARYMTRQLKLAEVNA